MPPEGLPPDYYRRIHEVEQAHWWHRGMLAITAALLGQRLDRRGLALLDAGCGTGGFLAWAEGLGAFERLCGIDVSAEALALARERVPGADLRLAGVGELPFEDGSFDLGVANDMLQHLSEEELHRGLGELRRVLRPDGALLVRTNGARRGYRASDEWRLFDRGTLGGELARAGFRCERLTHANLAPSALAALLGHSPRPPSRQRHGIPGQPGALSSRLAGRWLDLEARYLARPARALPYGHTLFALATPTDAR